MLCIGTVDVLQWHVNSGRGSKDTSCTPKIK